MLVRSALRARDSGCACTQVCLTDGAALSLLGNLFAGLGLALYFCWRLALVVLGCFPIVAMGGALQMKLMSGFGGSKQYEPSCALPCLVACLFCNIAKLLRCFGVCAM